MIFLKVLGLFGILMQPPTIGHKVYYRRRGGGSFPSLGHNVSREFDLLGFHPCTILTPTCINYPFSWFV